MTHKQLRLRIRANCCPISGFTPAQLDKHIEAIARTVENAKRAHPRRAA